MLTNLRQIWVNERKGHFDLLKMSNFVESENFTLAQGAEVRTYIPQGKVRSWVLSLHGGPESYEGDEIRYGGLYLELLKNKVAVVVLNYRGSSRNGKILGKRNQVWGRWKASILEDFCALRERLPAVLSDKPIFFLGASFGGALALLLGQSVPHRGILLFSPLLDLKTQIRRAGKNYAGWFDRRFSAEDRSQICFSSAAVLPAGPFFFCYGVRDEVLGSAPFHKMSRRLQARTGDLILEQNSGHCPEAYRDYSRRYQGAFSFIMKLSLRDPCRDELSSRPIGVSAFERFGSYTSKFQSKHGHRNRQNNRI